jgi:hypothetical protein
MRNAATTISTSQLDHLRREVAACRQTQSWAPGSTRSQWWPDVQTVLDAVEEDGDVAAALGAARSEAFRLAAEVAHDLVDVDVLAEALRDRDIDLPDDIDTVPAAVTWCRANGVTIDQAVNGARDGWIIDGSRAEVYASCRPLDEDDASYVVVDALTGHVDEVRS